MTDVFDTECSHLTPTDGNIFEDLGFTPEDAALLYAASQAVIEQEKKVNQPNSQK